MFVSSIISGFFCAERLMLNITPMYMQLIMLDVPPLLISGSG